MYQSRLLAAVILKLLFSSVIHCYSCVQGQDKYAVDPKLNLYKEEVQCYQPSNITGDTNNYSTEIWPTLDPKTGKLDISFMLRYDIVKYYFRLYVGNMTKEEECNNKNKNITFKHSTRTFETQVCSDQCHTICNNTGSVSFNFVYTDCYRIVVSRCDTDGDPDGGDDSYTHFYRTGYNKRPTFSYEIENTKIRLSYNKELKELTFESLLRDKYTRMDKTISLFFVDNTTVWALVLLPTKEMSYTMLSNTNNSINCNTENNVTCILSDVSESTKEISILTINDTRCAQGTVWTQISKSGPYKECCWKIQFPTPTEDDKVTRHVDDSNSISVGRTIGISIVVVVFVLIIIIMAIWLYQKRGVRNQGRAQDSYPLLPTKNQQLLLLYARDCPAFMNLMRSFRQVLEDYAQFKVYDCYDESQHWDEKSLNPSGWMLRLVSNPSIKIIVISSKCAHLRQRALSTHHDIRYADPNPNDLLFMPALQYLNETVTKNDYKKVFVVRFDGFSDDRVLFTHINEYTRFALPQHFQELINSLQESNNSNNELTQHDQFRKAVRTLQQDLTRLTKYVDQNSDYLSKLLFVTDVVA